MAYVHTCRLIWPRGVPWYKDALNIIASYLNRIDLWMIARAIVRMPTPIAPMSAAQLAYFDVAQTDYFPLAVRANDIAALEWLFTRGLFERLDLCNAIIPMHPNTYKWLDKHSIPTMHPQTFYGLHEVASHHDLLYVCLRSDAMECYLAFDERNRGKCAMMACMIPHLEIVKTHYTANVMPDLRGVRVHPDAADLLQSVHPNTAFHSLQQFHTRTAQRIHLLRPRTSIQWMRALTWDDAAAAWMDTLPFKLDTVYGYDPPCDRAIQWLIKHKIEFAELDSLPNWNNPPMRLFRESLMKNMLTGPRKRTCRRAIWHLVRDKAGHKKITRALNAHIHLPFAREDIDMLCQRADGELMSRIVPVFTKSHLVAALRAGNLPFLRWLVGIACKLGVEYCIKHVKHKRTWIWLRDNLPQRRYLIVSFSDNIDVHLRDQLRADHITFFRRMR